MWPCVSSWQTVFNASHKEVVENADVITGHAGNINRFVKIFGSVRLF
jgi:hypothetical protein